MDDLGALTSLLLPAVLVAFLALYGLAVVSGVGPETALLRAGLAAVVLAVLGRIGAALLAAVAHYGGEQPDGFGPRLDIALGADPSSAEKGKS